MAIVPLGIPLHRLLNRREIAGLLAEFESALPAGSLAVIAADGHILAGTAGLDQAALGELLAQVTDDQLISRADLLLKPLLAKSYLAGALVARKPPDRALAAAARYALRCLHHSLQLLLNQALELRDVLDETLDRYREINLLYHIGEAIGACLDPREISSLVLGETLRVIRAEVGVVLLATMPAPAETISAGDFAIKASFGPPDDLQALQQASDQVVNQVSQSGQPATFILNDPIGSILCAPLKTQEQVLGLLLLGRLINQPEFTAGDEKLVMALAGQAAIAIETARLHQEEVKQQRLEEELAIGRQIQLGLLPESCPQIAGWEFAAIYRPARLVGGDLYDFFELPGQPQQLSMVIADVTGKGVPAALFMTFSSTIIRTEAMNGRGPAAALEQTNRLVVQDIRSRLFLTAFYATLDTQSGRLRYANGGHDWPLWRRAGTGETQWLTAQGFLLGAFKEIELEEREVEIAPGDLLVFYTDGVTEARNAARQLFGEERLQLAVAANPEANAAQTLQTIVKTVEDFIGDTPQSDDLTLFVVRRQ